MNYTIRQIKTEEDWEELEKEGEARKQAARQRIRHDLNTQNNRATGHPMYCVCETPNGTEELPDPKLLIREIFFTNNEAKQYIEERAYEYDNELFIYVKSGNDNDGWKYARKLMKGNDNDN